jgi:predicted RNA-binding Zn-ribbon protein involved in translation (DUF1610 family)
MASEISTAPTASAANNAEPIRPYVSGEDLRRRIMCYHCWHSFPTPPEATRIYDDVKCPNCGQEEMRQHHKCHESDPLRHPLGWPYDDPTIPYDC